MKKGGGTEAVYYAIIDALRMRSERKAGGEMSPTGVSYFLISNYDKLSIEKRQAISKLEQAKILYSTGSWKALRRQGQKSEMMVIAYPICLLKSIRYLDIVKAVSQLHHTEGQIISRHRAQIEL